MDALVRVNFVLHFVFHDVISCSYTQYSPIIQFSIILPWLFKLLIDCIIRVYYVNVTFLLEYIYYNSRIVKYHQTSS